MDEKSVTALRTKNGDSNVQMSAKKNIKIKFIFSVYCRYDKIEKKASKEH